MESFVIVRPEHLNHHGRLFGGQLLLWTDEFAWIAAVQDFPTAIFVTRAMSESEFKVGVEPGSILRFAVKQLTKGISSVSYRVDVYAKPPQRLEEIHSFSNTVVLVAVDENGNKISLYDTL